MHITSKPSVLNCAKSAIKIATFAHLKDTLFYINNYITEFYKIIVSKNHVVFFNVLSGNAIRYWTKKQQRIVPAIINHYSIVSFFQKRISIILWEDYEFVRRKNPNIENIVILQMESSLAYNDRTRIY